MNMKEKGIRKIRYVIQALGIVITTVGIMNGYPIAMSVLLGINFIMGPIFCGWICPFGTLQDLFGILGDKLGIKKHAVPKILRQILVYLRYVLLLITILISTDFIFSMLSLDPRSNLSLFLSGNTLTIIGWSIIGMFLGVSLSFKRPFCNYLCIEGAKYGLVSTLRPITILRDENACINCNKCNKVCPMNIDIASHEQVRSLQCITCMECVSTCPVNNTLTIGITPIKNKNKKVVLPLIIITSLSVFGFIVYNNINYDNFSRNIGFISFAKESNVIKGESAVGYGDASGIADGVYTGTGTGFRGEMTVEVTVENEKITTIAVTETTDDAKWFDRAYSTIVPQMISSQTADVDTVSGATYSSMGIKEAVANALINGGGKNVEPIENNLPEAGQGHRKGPEGGHFHKH